MRKKEREIKFRIWEKREKRIYEVLGLDFHLYPGSLPVVIIEKDPLQMRTIYDGEYGVAILMQYTGLEDKNGKEIYEGDIVKSWMTGRMVVGYKDSMFSAFLSLKEEDMNLISFNLYSLDWKVIGNIYENP